MLQNEPLVAKIGVDTAENEPIFGWIQLVQLSRFNSSILSLVTTNFVRRRTDAGWGGWMSAFRSIWWWVRIGGVDADLCDQRLIGKRLTRSGNSTESYSSTGARSFFVRRLSTFCWQMRHSHSSEPGQRTLSQMILSIHHDVGEELAVRRG